MMKKFGRDTSGFVLGFRYLDFRVKLGLVRSLHRVGEEGQRPWKDC
jgi:hypothetical protein